MDEERIELVSEALDKQETRLKALNIISKIDINESLAEAWTDDLALALESESNEYNKLQILTELERISRDFPEIAVVAVPPVVKETNNVLEKFEGQDISENRKVSLGVSILESIINTTDPLQNSFDVRSRDIQAFLVHGNSEHRSLGYRLLGRAGTPDEVGVITKELTHEVDPVLRSRDIAVNDAKSIVLASLDDRGPLKPWETVVSFSGLYSSGFVDPDNETLDRVRQLIVELLRSDETEQRDRVLDAVERISRESRGMAEDITRDAYHLIDNNTVSNSIVWELLASVAKRAPTIVLDRSDRLEQTLYRGSPDDVQGALEVVATAAEQTSSVPSNLSDPTLRTLRSDDDDVVIAGIDAVAEIGFRPPPPRLSELAEGTGRIARAASEAREKLSSGDGSRSSTLSAKLQTAEVSVGPFEGDGVDLWLKRRTADGLWTDLNLGSLRNGIVKKTLEAVRREENVPVVFPYYDPSDVVLLAAAIVLDDPGSDLQLGLYSPGSRAHWGMKGQIREELEKYGLSDVEGDVVDATPLPNVVPHAYVWDGELKDDSQGNGPGRFVLAKKLHDFEQVADLDVVLLNLTSRTKEDFVERLESLESCHSNLTFVNAYSYYGKNERDGRPRYGPPTGLEATSTVPGVETIDPILEERSFSWKHFDTQIKRTTHARADGSGSTETHRFTNQTSV